MTKQEQLQLTRLTAINEALAILKQARDEVLEMAGGDLEADDEG